jgi:hypothetical protein
MAKIKVRLKAHHHFYIHNDIGNAAFYFKNRVDERIAKNDHDGVGLEIMAGLTLLAFEAEARFNFLGAKLITGWNEGGKTIKKIKAVSVYQPSLFSRCLRRRRTDLEGSADKIRNERVRYADGPREPNDLHRERRGWNLDQLR